MYVCMFVYIHTYRCKIGNVRTAHRCIAGPPTLRWRSTGCVVSVQLVSTSRRHMCAGASTNSRKRQRRKSPTSNLAPVREPHTISSLCQPWASPNPGPQRRRQLTGLLWNDHSTRHPFTGPMVQAFLLQRFMVQPCGPLTTLDGRTVCCWRWSEVRPELRPDGH